MRRWAVVTVMSVQLVLDGQVFGAERASYPAPRFPSYTKAPKSVEEVMPFARSIAAQTTGLQGDGFGILKKGESAAIVLEASADDMIVDAVKRAIEERGEAVTRTTRNLTAKST